MALPESFLEELLARNDIVDVVGSYVNLQQKKSDYWGLCPFHGEKTPSFHVVPSKQMYYCFGCHKGGGVINFIMEIEGVSYIDAVRLLAKRANLTVPEDGERPGYTERKKRLWDLNREAARYYHSILMAPEGAPGYDYLRGRQLKPKTITAFGLGYAPEGWDNLIRAMTDRGFSKGELLQAGLAAGGEKGHIYDRFRGRVIFPIIDLYGHVIGFGGRVLDGSEPKYLNSPETMIFNKRKNLYALNLAKKSKSDRIVLTEGYMDTISLYQAGFNYAVASLGTALTEDHASLLSKYTSNVLLAYDGDAPGVQAAQRAIPILRGAGLKVQVLHVTGAKDPDEYIKKYGPDAFKKLMDDSPDDTKYRMQQIKAKYDLTDTAQKVTCLQEIADLLAEVGSSVERDVYTVRAADELGVAQDAMRAEVKRRRDGKIRRQKKVQERKVLAPVQQRQPKNNAFRYKNVRSAMAEEGVIRLMLSEYDLIGLTSELKPEEFSSEVLRKFFEEIRTRFEQGKTISIGAMASGLEKTEMDHLASIMSRPFSVSGAEQAMRDYIAVIHEEAEKRSTAVDESMLLKARNRNRKKKTQEGLE